MSTPRTLVAVVLALVTAGVLGVFGNRWFSQWSRERAFAARLESGQSRAARVIEEVAVLPEALTESSGLAVSRTQPGVLWSHNDSGSAPDVYALDMSGRILARVRVANALASDWEDIAAGPCPAGAAPKQPPASAACLYLGDIGDNGRVRQQVTVYVIDEPRIDPAAASPPLAVARAFRYRYPSGPDDSEALTVLPNGDVIVITKGRAPTIDFFTIASADVARALQSGETIPAQYAGNTGIEPDPGTSSLVTGAAVSPDGATLAVRTYTEVFFFGLMDGEGGRHWRSTRPPCFLGDIEPQGEAIDFLDASTLLLTSERARGRPGTIHRVQC